MTIGERIKELRKKNDLTQEKLADFLNVSYQAVSKWECGISNPDLSLIGPLTKLFHVTADQLLGLSDEVSDVRRAKFEAAYHGYWKNDDKEANYRIAMQAVEEYPGDFKYLEWLASSEYYVAFNDEYTSGGSLDYFYEMLEKSRKHYTLIIENCTDQAIVEKAIWGMVLDLKYLGRREEAQKYAHMYPDKQIITKDKALEICLEGEERLAIRQKIVVDLLEQLLGALSNLWFFEDTNNARTMAAIQVAESIIHIFIPDENYLSFNWNLLFIHRKLSGHWMSMGESDKAIESLIKARKYAAEYDRISQIDTNRFTCPLLNQFEKNCKDEPNALMKLWEEHLLEQKYDSIRARKDFQALMNE